MPQSVSSCPPAGAGVERLRSDIVAARRAPLAPRIVELALALAAAALVARAYLEPWWSFRLYAPQYPSGLRLEVLLSGVRGDVREIDTLNHYIGMASLATAAPLERRFSVALVTLAAVLILGLLASGNRRAGFAALGVALAVPLGFIADSWFWLHRFGHQLDPRAPLDIPPFTPELFGNGAIGQFMTFARPEAGFWMALGAAVPCAVVLGLRACGFGVRTGEGA